MIKSVIFENENQKLVGIIHLPENLETLKKVPGIVMFHGFTGNKVEAHRLFVQVARSLCKAGFMVLRFDFRGSGDSDGEFEDITVENEVSDAEKALTFFLRQRKVDREKVGVIGLSMGGRVATILASKDNRIKFVVLYSAAFGPLHNRFLNFIKPEQWHILNSGESIEIKDPNVSSGWYLKKKFFETIDYIIPFEVMNKIKVPMLIIHGDQDQTISVEEAKKGYEIIKDLNNKNELYIISGGDHTFSQKEHTREVIEKTLKWLNTIL
ncbi:MAG: alpha/beta fold hydrolase [Nitrososphaeria archaeon]